MTTAELFKRVIETGHYKRGKFMCLSLLSYEQHSDVDLTEDDKAQLRREIKDFLVQVWPSSGPDDSLLGAINCAVEERINPILGTNTQQWVYESNIFRIGHRGSDCCFKIYSDWDNRFHIVNDFIEEVVSECSKY